MWLPWRAKRRAGNDDRGGDLDLAIVGAGPCGLAAAVAAKRAGLRAEVLERGCVVSGIYDYPTHLTFFSTAERLAIGDIPFVVATEKPTRRDALAYYRAVAAHYDLAIRQYELVDRVERLDDGFALHSRTLSGVTRRTHARNVVIATGYFGSPNRLGVPGEDLPHVMRLFREGHEGFRQRVIVVGGGNSAVETALDLYRAGAIVTMVHFGPTFDRNIKPWVVPDITNRLTEGSIAARWSSRVRAIDAETVRIETPLGEEHLPAQRVYLMLGYLPNTALLRDLDVQFDPKTGVPAHDPGTMETDVRGVYIAGVLASGNDANKTFIENGRHHGDLIVRHLTEGSALGGRRVGR